MKYFVNLRIRKLMPLLCGFSLIFIQVMGTVSATENYKQQELINRAKLTLENFSADKELQQFRAYMKYAHGVMIVPQYIKGAWLVGAAGGTGVLMVRNEETGIWSSPAFYSLRSLSAGLQVGGSTSEVVLLIMTEKGLELLASNTTMKLGADASVAAGPKGYSVEAATPVNFTTDYMSFARSKGIYVGLGLSGTAIVPKHKWNQAYYGQPVLPSAITQGDLSNPDAESLRQSMVQFFKDNY